MSNNDSGQFDLRDFDDFDQPTFAGSGVTDEIDLTPSEVITAQGGRNSRFVVLASVLALLTLVGAGGIIALAINQSGINAAAQQTAVAIYATNANAPSFARQTQTAIARQKTLTAADASVGQKQISTLVTVQRQVEIGLRLLGAMVEWTNGKLSFVPLAKVETLRQAVDD
jgi:hypothetical protein